jgi:hypothetical protein
LASDFNLSNQDFLSEKKMNATMAMTVEVSIQHSNSGSALHINGVAQSDSFHLHFIGKDEDCRQLWTIPMVDDDGALKNYRTLQEALVAANEKMRAYSSNTSL